MQRCSFQRRRHGSHSLPPVKGQTNGLQKAKYDNWFNDHGQPANREIWRCQIRVAKAWLCSYGENFPAIFRPTYFLIRMKDHIVRDLMGSHSLV